MASLNAIRCGKCLGQKTAINKGRGVETCDRCNGVGEHEVIGEYEPIPALAIDSINKPLLYKLKLNSESKFFRELRLMEDTLRDDMEEWGNNFINSKIISNG